MVNAIHQITRNGALVITNQPGTEKLLAPVYGDRLTLSVGSVQPGDLSRLLALHGSIQIVLLDRNDSDFFLQVAELNRNFIDEVRLRCEVVLIHDQAYSKRERLRIWNVIRC
jgi:hypothetical protein